MSTDYEKLGLFYLGKRYDLASGARLADPVLYDSKDLLTHAVCVGMTGSGKTGLGIGLIEEAAIDGIPVLAIDPKGDLSQLAADVSEAVARRLRAVGRRIGCAADGRPSVEAFAARRRSWRNGLTEWEQRREPNRRLESAPTSRLHPGQPRRPPAGAACLTRRRRRRRRGRTGAHLATTAGLLGLAGITDGRRTVASTH